MKGMPPTPRRDLDTSATEGKLAHETLYGSDARRAYHWRLCAFLQAVVALGLVVIVTIQAMEKQYAPVILRDNGYDITALGTPNPHWQPTDGHIVDELHRLIETIRGRTTDAQADRRMWQRMYDRSTVNGRTQLGQAYDELQKVPEKGRIQVDIISTNKLSDHSFDIRWDERRHDANTSWTGKIWRFRGVFTVVIELPTTLAVWQQNPKAVWIDGWNIGREEVR
jgi:type IV secretory pathway TrbF-like protein